ncbi:hypothetical protein pneo_cds_1071 [Pandoravirus neocaledonia]|uniref:Uncharacterized protein n=1 Tax=Pandoravirus neocaledonia TaxID=2107708 RepID=A0A2U7UDZ1_9VIRU|nr:hypothetical protein pneo_cds_1071 [Pandoravirus neocaledonia]AVK76678.1 hypothetical protein pneo_cds_1071 [Pandoravirus neocaledonia]
MRRSHLLPNQPKRPFYSRPTRLFAMQFDHSSQPTTTNGCALGIVSCRPDATIDQAVVDYCLTVAYPAGAPNLESAPVKMSTLDQAVADKLASGETAFCAYDFDDDVLDTTNVTAADDRLTASIRSACARLGYRITRINERLPQTFYVAKKE